MLARKTAREARPEAGEPETRPPDAQAEGFSTVREAHRSEVLEDYVELIAELIAATGEARPVEIAQRMGVRQPTVTKNLARLVREGLALRGGGRSVQLTAAGRRLAETCRHRHRVVVDFLLGLGLDPETAEADAEGIEHHVSDKTLAVFEAFLKRRG